MVTYSVTLYISDGVMQWLAGLVGLGLISGVVPLSRQMMGCTVVHPGPHGGSLVLQWGCT